MTLTETIEKDEVEKAVADMYRTSQRPKLRTSSAYVYSQLQKKGVRVTKQEVTDLFKRLHDKGVGVLHAGGFYRQKFDFKENPRSIFGNGHSEKDADKTPIFNVKVDDNEVTVSRTFTVTNQTELKRAIDTLMNLLTD